MTTVVGMATVEGVWMSADSMTNVYDRPVTGAVKILRFPFDDGGREMLLGFSGHAGMLAIARKVCEDFRPDRAFAGVPQRWCDALQRWCDALASALTAQ